MEEIILLKMGELVLKGLNRKSFEGKLLSNIKRRVAPFGNFSARSAQSTVYLEPLDKNCDITAACLAAREVFGVAAVSRAAACDKDVEAIVKTAVEYLKTPLTEAASFKVESKRADKTFPLTSIELSQEVGGRLHETFPHIKVDVRNPRIVVNIEIRETAAYIHAGGEPGAGGLPVGTGGRAVSLLSGGIDSPVAAYMIAKRGIEMVPVHFFSYPYTSERSKQKVIDLARQLARFCGRMTVHIVPFTKIQEEIRKNCPEELNTLVTRRFMMRISEIIAKDNACGAIVTGESLGQVASQTMESLAAIGAVCSLPVLRPVIGLDKEEIVTVARRIGTFDTSILPYDDCCTVFTPKHPKTKPVPAELERAEQPLDTEQLIEEAINGIEKVVVSL